jgi:hypothetical protein
LPNFAALPAPAATWRFQSRFVRKSGPSEVALAVIIGILADINVAAAPSGDVTVARQ